MICAILSTKKHFSEIAEIVDKICDYSITSESETSQLQSRQVVLQYLLDYPIGKKLDGFLEFYIQNLEYETEKGRQSALEMLALLVKYLPKESLRKFAGYVFPPLASRVVNDESSLCRKLTSVVLKSLLSKLNSEDRSDLYNLVYTWLKHEKATFKRLSVQCIGIFAEVEKNSFEKHLLDLLPIFSNVMDNILMETDSDTMGVKNSSDQLLFCVLCTLKKIFSNCDALRCLKFELILVKIWENAEKCLQHPHLWIQMEACQIYGQLFASWTPEEIVQSLNKDIPKTSYIYQVLPTRVKALCSIFCKQLQIGNFSPEAYEQITKNLIYLGKLINYMEANFKGPKIYSLQISDRSSNLKWLLRRMMHVARFEASQSQGTHYRRSNVFRWLAAISVNLGSIGVRPFLIDIMEPLHREMICSETKDCEIRRLSGEVLTLLREIAGKEVFSDMYAKLQKKVGMKKESRKRKRVEEAINDQKRFVQKKLKRSLAKRTHRKRN